VPGRVFFRAVIAVLITVALLRFFEQVMGALILIALSLILAAALNPLVAWLERHRFGRWLASLIGIATVVIVVLAVLGLVVPPLVIQGIEFAHNLPDLIDRWRAALAGSPEIFGSLERGADRLRENPMAIFTGVLRFGANAATTLFLAILLLTLTLYFLIDRERIRAAVLRQVPLRYRDKADLTLSEVARVVRAYTAGQAILSLLFALYTFILLTIFGLPYAAILAALAFFLDAIPNIGSLIATILPALVGLTRSLLTAIIVAGAILIDNQIENNLLGPRILSGRLEVPPVLTMIAIIFGGELFGIVGIIIAIPLAGIIPVIERIWLHGDTSHP
jgi:predicted PurR-regulated permease PerM